MNTSESLAPSSKASNTSVQKVSRGYTEEMEHFCYAVHNHQDFLEKSSKDGGLRCDGTVAMADAIMALTSNLAMKAQRRIVFKPEWFDPERPETPETDPDIVKWIEEAQG